MTILNKIATAGARKKNQECLRLNSYNKEPIRLLSLVFKISNGESSQEAAPLAASVQSDRERNSSVTNVECRFTNVELRNSIDYNKYIR